MKNGIFLILFLVQISGFSQSTQRPMIWVKPSDKTAILDKIKNQEWAKVYYQKFYERLTPEIKNHQADPKQYLNKMPLDWTKGNTSIPPMLQFKANGGGETEKREALMYYLQNAIDCGIVYYLTDDESYAQLALDVLHTFVEGMIQITPSKQGANGGGYIYLDDHLREAREIGAQLPIVYDFVHSFIIKGGKPFDVAKGAKVTYSFQNGEQVFKTYIKLALEQGIINCNWPVLESSSLVGNSLAINDLKERSEYLEYYLTKNTPNQDALLKVADFYQKNGGIWPESLGYANEVSKLSTYLMTLLTRYDANLDLGNKYAHIPMALSVSYYLTYPNKKETILFGDGHRDYLADYDSFEIAYTLGKISNNQKLLQEFGALIKSGINAKSYDRSVLGKRSYGAAVYREPLHLLWDSPEIEGEVKQYPLPTTDRLPFAGITLQRNFSPNGNEKDALMGFVGGGSHVHGHATGMSMELYGKGFVLAPKAGRGTYTTDIHENYYRLFASNNTVVVNGSSETEGSWVSLGHNTVELVAIEPALKQKPVSTNYSFSTNSFVDDKGDLAEAKQERTLGIVRTSPTTGYYIDVFRSKSALPNEYHDYIYRNLGEELSIEVNTKSLSFTKDDSRFMASASKEWAKNKKFKHPGWHFFKEIETATNANEKALTATFTAKKLSKETVKMRLFINNPTGREYSKALSPFSKEVANPYAGKNAQTLIIRKKGESWQQPFAVVYEPFEGDENKGSVQSVEDILQDGQFKGLKIKSIVEGKNITQYAFILESSDTVYENKKLGISFKGRYAILTFDDKENVQSVYVGEGKELTYKKIKITSTNDKSGVAYLDFTGSGAMVNVDKNLVVKY